MIVRGTGPIPCEFAIVGPYVGHVEDRTGRPFSGDTGQELDRYLDGYELPHRNDVYLTNLYKQYRGRDYVYTLEDLSEALPILRAELVRVQPRIVITLGRETTRLALGDVDITDVESIPWYLPEVNELSTVGKWGDSETVVYPIVHIAAGLRNPELSPFVVRGFQVLAQFLEGDVPARKLFDDLIPNPAYRLLEGDEVCHVLSAIGSL